MPPYGDKARVWWERAARIRRLADLSRDEGTAQTLRALAAELTQKLHAHLEIAAAIADEKRRSEVLAAELDAMLMRARGGMFLARHSLAPTYSAEDLREEARLCREEARAAGDLAVRRKLAARSTELAMLAEEIAQNRPAETS